MLRHLELFLMFVVAPGVLAVVLPPRLIFPAIWLLAGICVVVLASDPAFDRRRLWNYRGAKAAMPGVMLRVLGCGVGMWAMLMMYEPSQLLNFPRSNPVMWAFVMVVYPVLSALPQEVAFRAYFEHRYRGLFGREWTYVLVNAGCFAWAHIIMYNLLAIVLSFVASVILVRTYRASRSTLAVAIEHALLGCIAFTIGWGRYFYAGAR